MAQCLLCRNDTDHQLTGTASVGIHSASYTLHVCPGCWYLFEKFGTAAQSIRAEIHRQVEAAWRTP